MSALEQMRPFFRLCQFVGFFPFRVKIDERTGKFRQFSFSWRNPVTWWYSALSLSQFIVFPVFISALQDENQSSIKLPLTISMSLELSNIIYCLLLFSARFWVTFFFKTLRQAIIHMHIVEQFLGEHTHCCRCTIKLRIFIGIISIFIWVRYIQSHFNIDSN